MCQKNDQAFDANKTCSTCEHAHKRETVEPCATCVHEEYYEGKPAFGKWTAPGLKEAKKS